MIRDFSSVPKQDGRSRLADELVREKARRQMLQKPIIGPGVRRQDARHSVAKKSDAASKSSAKARRSLLDVLGKFYERAAVKRSLHPRLGVLYEPHVSSDEDQNRLHQVLRLCRESRALAARRELRLLADPMHGFALLVWLQERLQYHKDQYMICTRDILQTLEYVHIAILRISFRPPRRQDQGFRTKVLLQEVASLAIETNKSMRDLQTVLLKSDVIVGHNTLYAHAHIDTERWKVHCHAVLDAISATWRIMRDNKLPGFLKHPPVRRLMAMERAWRDQIRDLKALILAVQARRIQHQRPALHELQQLRSVTHQLWQAGSKVTSSALSFSNLYQNAIRGGRDMVDKNFQFEAKIDKMFQSPAKRDAEALMACLYFLRATRLSMKYNYQQWPDDAPRPVLPDFVHEAINSHRQRNGSSSIF